MLSAVSIALFAIALLLGVMNRAWAFAVIVCIFPLKQLMQASSGFFLSNGEYPNVLVALSAMLCLTGLAIRKQLNFRSIANPVFLGSLSIFSLSAASLIWTPALETASAYVRTGAIYFVLFVLVAPLLIDSLATLQRAISAFMILGCAIVFAIQLNPEFVFASGRLVMRFSERIGTNPLALGELGGLLILAGSLSRPSIRTFPLQTISIVLGALCAFQSGSRGQLIFALLCSLACFPISRSLKNPARFAAALIVSLASMLAILVTANQLFGLDVGARWNQRDLESGLVDRLLNYQEAFAYWTRYPAAWMFGLGFNSFSSITTAGWGDYAHNIFVELITEGGLFSLALFLVLVIAASRAALRLFYDVAFEPSLRATTAVIISFSLFYFLVANKQANLWGQGPLFMSLCLIPKLQHETALAKEDRWLHETVSDETGNSLDNGVQYDQATADI
jgi:O-antigen ligase